MRSEVSFQFHAQILCVLATSHVLLDERFVLAELASWLHIGYRVGSHDGSENVGTGRSLRLLIWHRNDRFIFFRFAVPVLPEYTDGYCRHGTQHLRTVSRDDKLQAGKCSGQAS
ncbi:hypothetical protein D3C84_761230 [compost metagenome]